MLDVSTSSNKKSSRSYRLAKGDGFGRECLLRKFVFSQGRNLRPYGPDPPAAVSIPANIAEGQGRRLTKEFLYFLANARGAWLELDTHLELALRLRYLNSDKYGALLSQLQEVGKILNGLMRAVEQNQSSNI